MQELQLVLFCVAFGVLILWSTTWMIIFKKKILPFLPFILSGLFSLFYAGILIRNPNFFTFDTIYTIFFFCNILILSFLIRREIWKK